MTRPSLYDALGVSKDADSETIKRAFRALASEHHPDKGGDTARMADINKAYECLSDPDRRQRYDEAGVDMPQMVLSVEIGKAVMEVFAHLIKNGDESNLIGHARNMLDSAMAQVKAEREKALKNSASVRSRREKVRAVDGSRNIFVEMCDETLRQIDSAIDQMDFKLKVITGAQDELKRYECDVTIASAPWMHAGLGSTYTV